MEKTMDKHGVKFLVHFTRCENLENIFKHGLLTRSYINENKIGSIFNDDYRLDGYENSICTSISFPNYKMFYKLRQENPSTKWAIIGIDKRVLLEKECAFCVNNAASNLETCIQIGSKKNKERFNSLFQEDPNKVSREVLGIDESMTTNPQSEVLIFDNIELEYIIGVVFKNSCDANEYKKYITQPIEVIEGENLFRGRCDYEFWR